MHLQTHQERREMREGYQSLLLMLYIAKPGLYFLISVEVYVCLCLFRLIMSFEFFLINNNFKLTKLISKVNKAKREPVPISTEQWILNLAIYDVFL